MTDNTLNLDALTEAFKADCKVIRLKYEYPGYTGTEKYAIISDLSYEQIVEKHAHVVKPYIPFLLLSKAAGEVFAEFKRNEDKFFKRMQRDDSYGFEDGTTELYNAGICVPDFTGELFEEEKDSRIVWAAFARLTPTQKKYVRQHLFGGKTFTRISQRTSGRSSRTLSLPSSTRTPGNEYRSFVRTASVRQQQGGQAFSPARCSVRTAVQSSISAPPRALTLIRSITAAPTTKVAEETVRYTISAM